MYNSNHYRVVKKCPVPQTSLLLDRGVLANVYDTEGRLLVSNPQLFICKVGTLPVKVKLPLSLKNN